MSAVLKFCIFFWNPHGACFCLGNVMEELSERFPELIAVVLCLWLSGLASH